MLPSPPMNCCLYCCNTYIWRDSSINKLSSCLLNIILTILGWRAQKSSLGKDERLCWRGTGWKGDVIFSLAVTLQDNLWAVENNMLFLFPHPSPKIDDIFLNTILLLCVCMHVFIYLIHVYACIYLIHGLLSPTDLEQIANSVPYVIFLWRNWGDSLPAFILLQACLLKSTTEKLDGLYTQHSLSKCDVVALIT